MFFIDDVTWEDVIELTCGFFEIIQVDIASALGIKPYQLSKIKSGVHRTNNKFKANYYNSLFALEAYTCKKIKCESYAELFFNLEDYIEKNFENIKQAMENYWVENPKSLSEDEASRKYEDFVKYLLDSAKREKNNKSSAVATKRKQQSNDNLVEIIPLDCDKIREIVNRSADQFLDK